MCERKKGKGKELGAKFIHCFNVSLLSYPFIELLQIYTTAFCFLLFLFCSRAEEES
jgi:prepilin signal peptidase PulO-like enzyme (type II secretory pathway)